MEFYKWLEKESIGSIAMDNAMRQAWEAGVKSEREACEQLRLLLAECAPMVYANSEALHMLDGFHPQEREYDDLARRLRKELTPNAE